MAEPVYSVPAANADSGGTPGAADSTNITATTTGSPHSLVLRDASGNIVGPSAATTVPIVPLVTAGADLIPVRGTNAVEGDAALTGDTAITWTLTADALTPPQSQEWDFRYSPATHHATFPNSTFCLLPAVQNAAALATAEGSASIIVIRFRSWTDGRITVLGWWSF